MQLTRTALISCSNKNGLDRLCGWLFGQGYRIISTGGTWEHISKISNLPKTGVLERVESVTGFPEILGGRVKTLHPKIHGGILADRDNPTHNAELLQHEIPPIDVVVANLYPFWKVGPATPEAEAVELIDIGGVALIRAAAKNFNHVAILTDPSQYESFCENTVVGTVNEKQHRKTLAAQAFALTSEYDAQIVKYFAGDRTPNVTHRRYKVETPLKYGCNPHQTPASMYSVDGRPVPLKILNGECGYINVLDAVGCWGLVRELQQLTGRVAACSFKHTSPAGAAVAVPFEELAPSSQILLQKLYGLTLTSSPALNAYVRARNADPQSSFGDFIGISTTVDAELAQAIKAYVSDGIVAPAYTAEALAILREKKKGNYVVLQMENSAPMELREIREMAGFAIEQPANTLQITEEDLISERIVTRDKTSLPKNAQLDLIVANACLKYAQSNNVACAAEGQLIGLSAGQQSRVHSVRLACQKAAIWLRRHEESHLGAVEKLRAQHVPFQDIINRTTTAAEAATANANVDHNYLLSLASDAFFPFPDSITEAAAIGVRYVTQTGGSMRDDLVIDECNAHNITMIFTGKRIFTH